VIYCIGCVRNESWSTAWDVSGLNRDLLDRKCLLDTMCQEKFMACR
jgi:hypothetical protein